MKQQTKTHPTLDALRRAIQTTDGSDATAFFLFATQDGTMGCSAFIGDGDRLAGALLALLNRVGEGRAMPQEMAMTRAVLMAVAAADVRNHGQLLDVIRQHRDAILGGTVRLTNGDGEDLLQETDDNFPIKREQDDACISHAEREESQDCDSRINETN